MGKESGKYPLRIKFYKMTFSGKEPVREWLRSLPKEVKKIIGEDIMTVQMTWPIGMPLVKNLGKKLLEIRSSLPEGIARIFFIVRSGEMVLLHGFIKKTQKTPVQELEIARDRMKDFQE